MRRVIFFPAGSVRVISMDMPQVGFRSGMVRWSWLPSRVAAVTLSSFSL